MKKTLRTFVAVEIDAAVREKAVELIQLLSATSAKVNWVESHNLHLTLKFLGEVPQRDITHVCRAVSKGAEQVEPFDIDIHGAGAFPNIARPRTVWLGISDGAANMIALHDCIESELAKLGYREEGRRFQPHLTIGRVRGEGQSILELGKLLQQQADYTAGRMHVNKATVFCSTLTREGPIYEVLGSATLGER